MRTNTLEKLYLTIFLFSSFLLEYLNENKKPTAIFLLTIFLFSSFLIKYLSENKQPRTTSIVHLLYTQLLFYLFYLNNQANAYLLGML